MTSDFDPSLDFGLEEEAYDPVIGPTFSQAYHSIRRVLASLADLDSLVFGDHPYGPDGVPVVRGDNIGEQIRNMVSEACANLPSSPREDPDRIRNLLSGMTRGIKRYQPSEDILARYLNSISEWIEENRYGISKVWCDEDCDFTTQRSGYYPFLSESCRYAITEDWFLIVKKMAPEIISNACLEHCLCKFHEEAQGLFIKGNQAYEIWSLDLDAISYVSEEFRPSWSNTHKLEMAGLSESTYNSLSDWFVFARNGEWDPVHGLFCRLVIKLGERVQKAEEMLRHIPNLTVLLKGQPSAWITVLSTAAAHIAQVRTGATMEQFWRADHAHAAATSWRERIAFFEEAIEREFERLGAKPATDIVGTGEVESKPLKVEPKPLNCEIPVNIGGRKREWKDLCDLMKEADQRVPKPSDKEISKEYNTKYAHAIGKEKRKKATAVIVKRQRAYWRKRDREVNHK